MVDNRSIKKVAVGLILTMLMAGLAGCGNKSKSNETASAPSGSKEIRIGGNYELTGGIASFGQSSVKGIEMAFDEINSAGGINGAKINFITVDNKSEPGEATNAAAKLISQEKVVAILGPVSSSNTLAEIPIATQYKVPVLSTTATNPAATVDQAGKVREYIFRSCFTDPFQGTIGANFALKELKVKKAAIYYDSASDYSKGLSDVFAKAFKAGGGQIVAQEAFLAKDTDFKATLTRIKNTNPEIVYLPAYYEEVGKIIRQARELGMQVPFVGTDGFDSGKLIEIAGAENLNNVFYTNHYSADDTSEKVKTFVKAYEQKFNEKPDALAALGYDGAYLLADALKRAESVEPEAIKKALAETKDVELVCGKVSLDQLHNPVKSAVIIELVDGVQKFKTRVNP